MLIGYARVSTDDQRLDLQMEALLAAGIEEGQIYQEHVSGAKTNRPILDDCIKACREGDTLVVWRLDRLGRSLPDLIKILDGLHEKGVGFRSLNESIDTNSAMGKMVFHMLGAVAQFERDIISERTKAGLKAARARGHRGGRKPVMTKAMTTAARAMLADEYITMQNVADTLKVSRTAVYNALKREGMPAKMKALKKAAAKADRHIEALEKPDEN